MSVKIIHSMTDSVDSGASNIIGDISIGPNDTIINHSIIHVRSMSRIFFHIGCFGMSNAMIK